MDEIVPPSLCRLFSFLVPIPQLCVIHILEQLSKAHILKNVHSPSELFLSPTLSDQSQQGELLKNDLRIVFSQSFLNKRVILRVWVLQTISVNELRLHIYLVNLTSHSLDKVTWHHHQNFIRYLRVSLQQSCLICQLF